MTRLRQRVWELTLGEMVYLREQVRVVNGVNILVGIWLLLAPFALRFQQVESAFWNSVVVGIVMIILATLRAVRPLRFASLSWVSVAVGIWLMGSPFLLGYGGMVAPTLSHLLVGACVVTLATWGALGAQRAER